jgi:Protein of unknown function (DUF3305)
MGYSGRMSEKPAVRVSVVLERTPTGSAWQTHEWRVASVIPDVGGDARVLVDTPRMLHKLFPGFEVIVYRDEAEGYYLNMSSEEPSIFVCIRMDEPGGPAYPFQVTASYNEAARWMDSSEKVERALMWPELAQWLGTWVEENYRPEKKVRQRPKSFKGKEGRLREEG